MLISGDTGDHGDIDGFPDNMEDMVTVDATGIYGDEGTEAEEVGGH